MDTDIEVVREALRRFNRRAGVLSSDPYGIGLSLSQSSALVDIERFGKLKPNELARLLRLDRSSISRMINVLVDKKLISTVSDPLDHRSKNLVLSVAGKKAVSTINKISNRSVMDVLTFLDPKERKGVAAAFKKLAVAVSLADQKVSQSGIERAVSTRIGTMKVV